MMLNQLTIKHALEGLRKKEFSCSELVQSCLTRIKTIEPKINAFITVNSNEALDQAKKYDEQISQSADIFNKKPLIGIPLAIKDIYSTDGIRTTAGSKIISDYIPSYDATAVKRLKVAGAIMLGKTNLDAWAHGASGENSEYGPTHNPYDLDRVPGGSSSGSATAVASDEALAAMGTDTGGSIRQPASFCNLVGLKPTYGRVSRYGIIAMASSFDSIGHFSKTICDNAKILEVTAGIDPYDATSTSANVDKYSGGLDKGVKGIKIGIPQEYFISGMDKEVEQITNQAIKKYEKMGAIIKKINLPHTQYAMACYYILVPSEISSNLGRYDGVRFGKIRNSFGDEAKRRIMLGTYTLSSGYYDAYYLKAAKVRTLIKKDFEEAFKSVDVLLAPVAPTPAFKIGEKKDDPLKMYLSDIFTCPVNIAGLPGLSVPAGFTNSKLPVGIQIIGPQFSEKLLYQVGYALEQETKYYESKPRI